MGISASKPKALPPQGPGSPPAANPQAPGQPATAGKTLPPGLDPARMAQLAALMSRPNPSPGPMAPAATPPGGLDRGLAARLALRHKLGR